jgi:hypothetical protein
VLPTACSRARFRVAVQPGPSLGPFDLHNRELTVNAIRHKPDVVAGFYSLEHCRINSAEGHRHRCAHAELRNRPVPDRDLTGYLIDLRNLATYEVMIRGLRRERSTSAFAGCGHAPEYPYRRAGMGPLAPLGVRISRRPDEWIRRLG